MSAFKDTIKGDITATFLSMEEFGQVMTVDGVEMHVILDRREIQAQETGRVGTHRDGLYRANLVLYVSADEYGAKPKQGKLLTLDGKGQYRITTATDEDGIYALELEANRV